MDKELFLNYLKSQNSDLLADATVCKVLNLWPLRKNKKILQATIQLNTDVYNRVMSAGGLLIGINICKVYDNTTVNRCFRCNGFNHSKGKCPRPIICPICAAQHPLNECHSLTRVCSNCRDLKSVHGFDISIDHSAFDYKNCAAYKLATAKLRNLVFGEPISFEIKKIPNFTPVTSHLPLHGTDTHKTFAENLRTNSSTRMSNPVVDIIDNSITDILTSNSFAALNEDNENFLGA